MLGEFLTRSDLPSRGNAAQGSAGATETSLGRYGDLSLAQAVAKAAELRSGRQGSNIDPLTIKRGKSESGGTFESVARDLIASKRAGWKNAKHAAQWSATLEIYAYPTIGARDVAAVDTATVLEVLRPI